MSDYEIGKLNGECVLVYYDAAGRHRYRLGTKDPRQASRLAPAVYAELIKPKGKTVGELFAGYKRDMQGRALLDTLDFTWKSLEHRFNPLPGDAITVEDCRAHVKARREVGIKDGTIHTELGRLRMVLAWAVKQGLLDKASYIERPSPPKRREDYHLTREQCRALIDAVEFFHTKLYIIVALGTGARKSALLGLTWDRVNFEREQIDLRDPTISIPHKGRAIVPMNRTVKAALLEAKAAALSPYVIEWGGQRVKSVRKGLEAAGKLAKVGHVATHLLRHSAAVHMAEAGISMEEIAQYLGHEDVNVTRRIYARFSPTYLKKAAGVLEY